MVLPWAFLFTCSLHSEDSQYYIESILYTLQESLLAGDLGIFNWVMFKYRSTGKEHISKTTRPPSFDLATACSRGISGEQVGGSFILHIGGGGRRLVRRGGGGRNFLHCPARILRDGSLRDGSAPETRRHSETQGAYPPVEAAMAMMMTMAATTTPMITISLTFSHQNFFFNLVAWDRTS